MNIIDGLVNLATGMGVLGKDKSKSDKFVPYLIGRDQMDSLYRFTWIGRKIVDIRAEDETREWRNWLGDEEEARLISEEERRLKLKERVCYARKMSRLYGGAAILIGDGSRDPKSELKVESIVKGGIKYLHVFNRHEMSVHEWEEDITSNNFGNPKYYLLQPEGISTGAGNIVHYSRFIFFNGNSIPSIYRIANEGWGDSIFQSIFDSIRRLEGVSGNIEALTQEAKTDIIKINDLADHLSDPEAEKRLIKRFTLASTLKSTINTLLLGGDETFDRKQITFAGLENILMSNLQIVSGAADVPTTRLLGQSPAGLSSTGESDLRNYYDSIKSDQTSEISDSLFDFDEMLIRSSIGYRPEKISFTWNSLWQSTPEQKANVDNLRSQIHERYSRMRIFDPIGLGKAIRDDIIQNEILGTLDKHVDEDSIEEPDDNEEDMF